MSIYGREPIVILIAFMVCSGCMGSGYQDDRTFYRPIDTKDWPGDALSEKQVVAAIDHFKDSHACSNPWRWALIGPNTFLLKGTDYLVTRHINAPVSNVGFSKGYWGGVPFYDPIPSVAAVKRTVEKLAADDCKYEHE